MLKRFYRDTFVANVSVVAAGSGISQVIALAGTPIITRIYAPEDLGQFGMFLSFLSIATAIGCLRYELAIPLLKSHRQSTYLLGIMFRLSVAMSLGAWFLYVVATGYVHPDLQNSIAFSLLFPLMFIAVVWSNILNVLATREKLYLLMNKSKIFQSSSQTLIKIIIGLAYPSGIGLALGYMAGVCAGLIFYYHGLKSRYVKNLPRISFLKTRYFLVRHKNFLVYSTPGSLINVLSANLPVLMVTSIYGVGEAGFFVLAISVIGIPLSVIGGATANVFYSEGASMFRKKEQEFIRFYYQALGKLMPVGILLGAFIYLAGNYGFVFIFGDSWKQAGVYAGLLSLLFVARFVASSIANTLTILRKQKVSLFIHIGLLSSTLAVFAYARYAQLSIYNAILHYSVVMCCVYLAVLIVVTYIVTEMRRSADIV